MHSRESGALGEKIACNYLLSSGYNLIGTNIHLRYSELDIICEQSGCLVFVEVKLRLNSNFGSIYESLNKLKLKRLTKAANLYLHKNKLNDFLWRMDAVLIYKLLGKFRLEHYKDILSGCI